MSDLAQRVERLEIIEATRSTFQEYIAERRVASSWGRRLSGHEPSHPQEALASHARRDGRPVVFRP